MTNGAPLETLQTSCTPRASAIASSLIFFRRALAESRRVKPDERAALELLHSRRLLAPLATVEVTGRGDTDQRDGIDHRARTA